MSNPEERNRDSNNSNTKQAEPPIDKQDPTEPVQVQGKAKASADVGADAAGTGAAGK